MVVEEIKCELAAHIDKEKAEFLPRFFQTGRAGYGEGDQFIGVRVPLQRKVARKFYRTITLDDLRVLLQDPIHEYRSTALIMLVHKYQKVKTELERKEIAEFYLDNISYVNNWDLVDLSADKILGPHLLDKDRQLIYDLAASGDLWKQRIAVMTTFHFIRQHEFMDTLRLAKLLINHEHHLIHKAVGWMLREIGNRDFQVEYDFLKDNYQAMPRTMLRYAIEKFDPELRQRFLKGLV